MKKFFMPQKTAGAHWAAAVEQPALPSPDFVIIAGEKLHNSLESNCNDLC